MKLPFKLERPLAVLDIESTGLNPRLDRIVELAIIKVLPDGGREERVNRFNPGMPIPAEVTAIHNITDADVAEAPAFADLAPELWVFLDGCDLAGFGVARFDLPMLREEFNRCGMTLNEDGRRVLDAQAIFHKKEPRNLTAALAFYCGVDHPDAHGAMADTEAALKVLAAQLLRYEDLPSDMDRLDEYCSQRKPQWADKAGRLRWENGELLINFGVQNMGRKLDDLARANPGFLKWIIKSDFPCDTKKLVAAALEKARAIDGSGPAILTQA
ncbi:MAG: 3'-5' exonuclease [Lentisphaerae bacterium]|nr:3'-5' exonuclease [Lentisphaerota bacterium]